LPDFEPASARLSADQLHELTEDLWSARSPNDRFVIDVGWYPEANAEGHFRCQLIVDDDWVTPLQEVTTKTASAVKEWAAEVISQCLASEGDAGDTMSLPTRAATGGLTAPFPDRVGTIHPVPQPKPSSVVAERELRDEYSSLPYKRDDVRPTGS